MISAALREGIRAGDFEVGRRIPSEVELAERFGASGITVNKAVGVLVQEGYLRRQGSSRAGTVVKAARPYPQGVIAFAGHVERAFESSIMAGALKAARRLNYLIAPIIPEDGGRFPELASADGAFKGVLTTLGEPLESPLPTIYIDKTNLDGLEGARQVRCDAAKGARALARALLDAGHREVAYLSFHERNADPPRRRSFIETMIAGGVADMERRVFFARTQELGSARNALRMIMERIPSLSALACENDYESLLAMRAGREMGVDIGGGVALAGFGNIKEIQSLHPFATVEQHPEESGYRACSELVEWIERPDLPRPALIELEADLVNADLIGRPRPAGG